MTSDHRYMIPTDSACSMVAVKSFGGRSIIRKISRSVHSLISIHAVSD